MIIQPPNQRKNKKAMLETVLGYVVAEENNSKIRSKGRSKSSSLLRAYAKCRSLANAWLESGTDGVFDRAAGKLVSETIVAV